MQNVQVEVKNAHREKRYTKMKTARSASVMVLKYKRVIHDTNHTPMAFKLRRIVSSFSIAS